MAEGWCSAWIPGSTGSTKPWTLLSASAYFKQIIRGVPRILGHVVTSSSGDARAYSVWGKGREGCLVPCLGSYQAFKEEKTMRIETGRQNMDPEGPGENPVTDAKEIKSF